MSTSPLLKYPQFSTGNPCHSLQTKGDGEEEEEEEEGVVAWDELLADEDTDSDL